MIQQQDVPSPAGVSCREAGVGEGEGCRSPGLVRIMNGTCGGCGAGHDQCPCLHQVLGQWSGVRGGGLIFQDLFVISLSQQSLCLYCLCSFVMHTASHRPLLELSAAALIKDKVYTTRVLMPLREPCTPQLLSPCGDRQNPVLTEGGTAFPKLRVGEVPQNMNVRTLEDSCPPFSSSATSPRPPGP